jgi:DNA-binding NtrC family response regulator
VTAPVFLAGEPGAGKETVARIIHYLGPGRERSFAALDCRRLPPPALNRLLFHDRGTALGTIYLREISFLPRELQLQLGHCLAGRSAQDSDKLAQPRFIAGSSTPLKEAVQKGNLLEDLACALGTLVLEIPPLRERGADLPALVRQFLERANEEGEKQVLRLTAGAWEILRGYSWPGNLAELYSVLGSARLRAEGDIDGKDLPAPLRLQQRVEQTSARPHERLLPLEPLLEEAERRLIRLALQRTGGHQGRAARLLSIKPAKLARRMKDLKIEGREDTP